MLYYQKKYPEALEKIQRLLAGNENQKSFELKALILKSSGQMDAARGTYNYLLQKMKAAGLAKIEAVGTYFDVGVIELNAKNYAAAKKQFDYCISNNFNLGASRLFRGVINTQLNDYPAALNDFIEVLKSDAVSLKALASIYISDIHSKSQNYDESIFFMAKALEYSKSQSVVGKFELSDEIINNQKEVSDRIAENIANLNQPQYFKNIAVILGYDSNVLSVPAAGSVADSFSGKSSNKLVLKGLFGHAMGQFEDQQELWSYQFTGNLNQNRQTETGQFMVNDFNYIWNLKPLSENSKSYRINVNSNFQYQVNPTSNKGAFGPYNLAATGVYTDRYRISEKRMQAYEYFFKYEDFLQDPAFSTFMKKTGFEGGFTYIESWDTKKLYYNPILSGTLKARWSNGDEYRNVGFQLAGSNPIYFSPKHLGTVILSYAYFNYFQRQGIKRADNILSAQWDETYQISTDLNLLLSLDYIDNNSNITDVYKFNRYLVSTGASYSF